MATKFSQGWFTPKNIHKYVGDVTKIRYMSSWELNFDKFLDGNPNILRWSSECIGIPYIKPTDQKVHTYYPDYWIEYKDKNGNIVQEILEIKPKSQVTLGKRPSKYAQLTWAVNMAKWESCKRFCESKGIGFKILTEEQLFN